MYFDFVEDTQPATIVRRVFNTQIELFGDCHVRVIVDESEDSDTVDVHVDLEGFFYPPVFVTSAPADTAYYYDGEDERISHRFVDSLFTSPRYSDRLAKAIKELVAGAIDNYVFGKEFVAQGRDV